MTAAQTSAQLTPTLRPRNWLRLSVGHAVRLPLRHLPIVAVLALGLVLRLLAFWAYYPALEYPDSTEYLAIAARLVSVGHRPVGYSVFLNALSHTGHLGSVTLAQHLLGLLTGLFLYMLLSRAGVRSWIATLGVVPLLLDAYQVDIEQYILAETLADVLLTLGAGALLWSERPASWQCAVGGLLLALAGLTRIALLPVIVPAVLFIVLRRVSWRSLVPATCMSLAFALPLAGYAAWNYQSTGRYTVSNYTGFFLYGRVAPIADCSRLSLTPEERRLCPAEPLGSRPSTIFFLWDPRSPFLRTWPGDDPSWSNWQWAGSGAQPAHPTVQHHEEVAQSFDRKVIQGQPWSYLRVVLGDALQSFEPNRNAADNWFWVFPEDGRSSLLATVSFGHAGHDSVVLGYHARSLASPGVAGYLVSYQRIAATPGPALALFLLAGLGAGVGLAWPSARQRRLRWMALVLAVFGATVLIVPPATAQFDYRYVLPALVLLPPSAAAAVEMLLRTRSHRQLDLSGDRLGQLPGRFGTPNKKVQPVLEQQVDRQD